MSTQTDEPEYRSFTPDEFQKMQDEGIISPDEEAILHDGFVWVPNKLAQRFRAVSEPGPYGATVSEDVVLAEAPPIPHARQEVARTMATRLTHAPAGFARRKFTVDEYYRMAEVGILSPDERTELLEGEIIVMTAIGSKHAFCVKGFTKAFAPLVVVDRIELGIQDPVSLDEGNGVQPDVTLVRPISYSEAHPRPEDIFLLVEVADTTIGYDRRHKFPNYARHGVPEAWLADVNAQVVEVHTNPRDGVYTNVQRVGMDGVLTPTAFPDVSIAVKDVFRW